MWGDPEAFHSSQVTGTEKVIDLPNHKSLSLLAGRGLGVRVPLEGNDASSIR
jgi:hypothetical protein